MYSPKQKEETVVKIPTIAQIPPTYNKEAYDMNYAYIAANEPENIHICQFGEP